MHILAYSEIVLYLFYLELTRDVTALYFYSSMTVTLLLLILWGYHHKGDFPEFSELGYLGPIKARK
jgi:hypothetical protein